MTWWIVMFLAAGLLFGLATCSRRHNFSEGSAPPRPGEPDPLGGRLLWIVMCSLLWPLYALTGLYTRVRNGPFKH